MMFLTKRHVNLGGEKLCWTLCLSKLLSVILLRTDINRRLLISLDVGQVTCFFTVVIGTNL